MHDDPDIVNLAVVLRRWLPCADIDKFLKNDCRAVKSPSGSNVLMDATMTNKQVAMMQVSDDLLKTYLDSYQQTPWAALRYLVAEANYGGRVTDELDRRVLNSYMNNFYTEEALSTPDFALSPLPEYHIPQTSTLQGFKVHLTMTMQQGSFVLGISFQDAFGTGSAALKPSCQLAEAHHPI